MKRRPYLYFLSNTRRQQSMGHCSASFFYDFVTLAQNICRLNYSWMVFRTAKVLSRENLSAYGMWTLWLLSQLKWQRCKVMHYGTFVEELGTVPHCPGMVHLNLQRLHCGWNKRPAISCLILLRILLSIHSPTLKSVAMSLYNIIVFSRIATYGNCWKRRNL